MTVEAALAGLTFGSVNSEAEQDLDRLFVRTGDFDKFLRPQVWLALGAKGTGKSALFELFTKYERAVREIGGHALDDVIIAAGTGFGDLSEIATGDLESLKHETDRYDHDRLWRLYIAIKAGLALGSNYDIPRGPLRDLLVGLGEKRDFRIGPLLGSLWSLAIGNAPSQVSVSTGGATIQLKANGREPLDVVTLLQSVNEVLVANHKVLWLLFDKIDEIWPSNRAERQRALEGLMTAVMQIRRTFPAIQPKVLIRTDLWSDLDFTNKDHLTDKRIELSWTKGQLESLLLKRSVSNPDVREYIVERNLGLQFKPVDEWTADERLGALLTVFPMTAYPGEREAAIMDWLVERVKDGRGTVLPRDSIVLANNAVDEQRERGLNNGPSLLSREVMREAFTKTSVIRVESFLAEFPDLREHFRRFSGQTKSEFSRGDILELMSGLQPNGDTLLDRLHEIGVLKPDTGRLVTAQSFEIPRLYRTGLGLVIRGRP